MVRLLSRGEERLLRAVEFGQIPFSVAIQIADAEDRDVQGALQDAYEKKLLRGRKLLVARRIIEKRRLHGRHISKGRPSRKLLSGEAVVQAYEKDVKKKRLIVRRAQLARDKITFVAEALRRLLDDRPFKNILVEEGLDTFPRNLTSRSNFSKE